MRLLRQRNGWTARDLAARCAQIGAPQITHTVVTNLETGRAGSDGRRRREVSVDEMLILACALNVPPAYLLVPLEGGGDLEVTPMVRIGAFGAAAWLGGEDTGPAEEDTQARSRFRRSKRPLNLLRHAWMTLMALDVAHHDESVTGERRKEMLADLAQRLTELDALGLAAPPLPPWLIADLDRAGLAVPAMEG